MKQIQSINLMEDKKLIVRLNLASLPLMVVFFILFTGVSLLKDTSTQHSFSLLTSFLGLVLLFLLIIIHELIHGFFFKLFNPEGKVKFGFKNGLAYATSPHSYYSKGQFSIISLAPFVLITSSLMLVFFTTDWLSPSSFILQSSLHAAACVGDFYFIYLLLKAPKQALIEDTEQGINFYLKEA
ncbi:DUF3267 domain-containing protein [Enterococcus olivae]